MLPISLHYLVQRKVRHQNQRARSRPARVRGPEHGAEGSQGVEEHPHGRGGHAGRGRPLRVIRDREDGGGRHIRIAGRSGADRELRPHPVAVHVDVVGHVVDRETAGGAASRGGSIGRGGGGSERGRYIEGIGRTACQNGHGGLE